MNISKYIFNRGVLAIVILFLSFSAPMAVIVSADERPIVLQQSIQLKTQAAFTSCADVTEIPQSECEALVSLYNSTDGGNWGNNTDWLQTETPCSWFGVSCWSGHIYILNLYNNQLTGSIPSEIGNLTNISSLYLNRNYLTGNIPPEIGNLTNLTGLELYLNQLTGNIPPEIGNLTKLTGLKLHGNYLTGSIPPEIGNLTKLTGLKLNDNQLTGSIPSEIGNLPILLYLVLSFNQFSGPLPQSLTHLTYLDSFLFEYTNFSFAKFGISSLKITAKANLYLS